MKTNEPKSKAIMDDVWIPTTCLNCYNACSIKAHRVDGKVVMIEGNPASPQNVDKICARGIASIMSLYSPDRVKAPLKRTNPEKGIGIDPKWVEISWEEALDIVTEKLKKVRQEDPRKLIIQSFDKVFLNDFNFHAAFASAFKTPNFGYGAACYFCGSNLHPVGYLTNAAFHFEPDLNNCNYLILIGAQHGFGAGEDATGSIKRMADARIRGMKVVVVDPICSSAASKADEWLPIRPGTDGAFALAVINVLLNELGIYDAEFIKKHTNGPYLIGPDGHYLRDKATNKPLIWDSEEAKAKTHNAADIKDFALEGKYEVNSTIGMPAFQLLKNHVRKYTCEEVAKITTIPAETIRRIAGEFGKAARIGSKIVIDGKELPYRPVCTYWRKGANQHRHSQAQGFAIQLMNVVVGAIDVPGGMFGMNSRLLPGKINNWSFGPREDEDGMVVPEAFHTTLLPYPAREVKRPQTVSLLELYPVAHCALWEMGMLNPEKFKLPYKPEVLLHSWSNMMVDTVDPKVEAEVFKKLFQISFAFDIDETVEFADIVFPDTHYLETLNPALEVRREIAGAEKDGEGGLGYWLFPIRQPVVTPPPGVRSIIEVLLEIAERVGFLKDLYHMMNVLLRLQEPYKLDLDKKYTWPEIVDNWAKSWFGPEHGLAYLKEHGFISFPKQVEEAYTTPFGKARIPVYVEYFIKAGEDVKRVTEEMGITDWDVSDYEPLPEWKPCPAYEEKTKDYDLYPVNYRAPFHTLTQTMNNVWLHELGEYHPYTYYILIHRQVAKKKGIKDMDIIRLQTEMGNQVEGIAKVTDLVHPEVVGICGAFGGRWARGLSVARGKGSKGKGVNYSSLIPAGLDRIDKVTAGVDTCVKVKVSKIGEVKK